MSFLGRAIKSGVALKAAKIAQRELSKPENQRKARELANRLMQKRRGPGTSPTA